MRRHRDARRPEDVVQVGHRHELDDADLVEQPQPIGAREVHAERERRPDDHQKPVQDEADEDAAEREDRPELPPQEVPPDERQELHATAASISEPFSRWSVRVARSGGVRVVRDHDDRLAVLAIERLQQLEDLVAGLAIEVAGRLVAEQQRRVGDDRARDADALLLAAGELARVVLRAVGQADDLERDRRARLRRSRLRQLREQQRQLDVALGGQHRQQVVELEDEADVLRAPLRQRAAAERRSISHAGDLDRAARRLIEAAHQIEQRRLARSGRPHQRQKIALRESSRLTPLSTSMRSLPRVKYLWTSRTVTRSLMAPVIMNRVLILAFTQRPSAVLQRPSAA